MVDLVGGEVDAAWDVWVEVLEVQAGDRALASAPDQQGLQLQELEDLAAAFPTMTDSGSSSGGEEEGERQAGGVGAGGGTEGGRQQGSSNAGARAGSSGSSSSSGSGLTAGQQASSSGCSSSGGPQAGSSSSGAQVVGRIVEQRQVLRTVQCLGVSGVVKQVYDAYDEVWRPVVVARKQGQGQGQGQRELPGVGEGQGQAAVVGASALQR